jgi:exosortase
MNSMRSVMTTLESSQSPQLTPTEDGNAKPFTVPHWIALLSLLVALGWAYQAVIRGLIREWQSDENYSVGQLVPFAALYLIWNDRQQLARYVMKPCWWGAGLIVLAQALRGYGLYDMYESLERYSFILTIAGLVLLLCGWQIFRKVYLVILFLFLMVPLPGRVHNAISSPMQTLATNGAVMMLELMGIVVTQEGNVMVLNDSVRVAVAEACSGLRMLTAFIVVSAVFAYVIKRPAWQKVLVLCSSIPIAIFCNLVRLVITALLFMWTSSEMADRFFHDFAGLTMMPMAVMILVGELFLISRLVIEEQRGPNQAAM